MVRRGIGALSLLCITLFRTHAGLHYVDDIIAEFLALVDDIHIDSADAVGIDVVVHIVNILTLQLVTEVVDLILDVERTVHIEALLAATHQVVHLGKGTFGELHHLVHVLILASVEMLILALYLAVDGTCHIITGITDGLQLADLAEHRTDLSFGFIGEVCIGDLFQIRGDLYLHIVGDALVFLYTGEQLGELLVVFLGEELTHHSKHPLHTLAEADNLFLGFEHRELRRLQETSGNEMQAEILLIINLLRLDYPANETFRR